MRNFRKLHRLNLLWVTILFVTLAATLTSALAVYFNRNSVNSNGMAYAQAEARSDENNNGVDYELSLAADSSRATPVQLNQIGDFVISGNVLSGISSQGFAKLASGGVTPTSNSEIKVDFAVAIPNSVTSINAGAFSGCSTMVTIALPFVGGSATATSASASTLFGYIFGTTSYTGATSITQYYNGSSTARYYIPNKLTSVRITGGTVHFGAFYGCRYITSVFVGANVTSIGERAFQGCSALTNISIDNGIKSIGASAFVRTAITSISIPSSVKQIGEGAFNNVTTLSAVLITDLNSWVAIQFANASANPLSVANSLRLNNTEVVNATLTTATVINNFAFYHYTKLQKITIPGTVKTIGFSAFNGCTNLTNPAIPTSVTLIDEHAFEECTSITAITVPDSTAANQTKTIKDSAFNKCNSLTSVHIGKEVTTIGKGAFAGCTSVAEMTLPFVGSSASATSASNSDTASTLFGWIFGSTYYVDGTEISQYYSSSASAKYYIPSTLKKLTITGNTAANVRLNYGALSNMTMLTEVIIEDGVNYIYDSTLRGCSNITNLTIPFVGYVKTATSPSTTTVFGYIFGASSYTGGRQINQIYNSSNNSVNYYIPTGLTTVTVTGGNILYGAFYNCSMIEEITLPERAYNYATIYDKAFFGCTGITEVEIPAYFTSINTSAFQNCSNLNKIILPQGVTTFGSAVFTGCTALTGVYISDINAWAKITFSDANANPLTFAHNLYLNDALVTNVTLTTATKISNYAFYGYDKITNITIPTSVSSIGNYAFYNCVNLGDINVPNASSIGTYAFYGCSSIEKVIIGSTTSSIGDSAFSHCSGITEMTLPIIGNSRLTSSNTSVNSLFGFIFGTSSYEGGTAITQQTNSSSNSRTFYIPSGLKTLTITTTTILSYGAFYNCTMLEKITLPDTLRTINQDVFRGCSALKEIHINSLANYSSISFGSATASPFNGNEAYLYIGNSDTPATELNITGTSTVSSYAFTYYNHLTSVDFQMT